MSSSPDASSQLGSAVALLDRALGLLAWSSLATLRLELAPLATVLQHYRSNRTTVMNESTSWLLPHVPMGNTAVLQFGVLALNTSIS